MHIMLTLDNKPNSFADAVSNALEASPSPIIAPPPLPIVIGISFSPLLAPQPFSSYLRFNPYRSGHAIAAIHCFVDIIGDYMTNASMCVRASSII